jgi:uncharacterized DUF497 family protein
MDVYHLSNGETFVWNRDKATTNLIKHGVRFEEAVGVFSDPYLRAHGGIAQR